MLSRYKILKKLGAGGMGMVYKAEDIALKRPVALKFLTEESFSREQLRVRFLREAQLAASLNHPNICTIYEVAEVLKGEEQTLEKGEQLKAGIPFISMELVEGKTLASLIEESGPLSLDKLIEISLQIVEGLVAAHSQGIIHRDLKPQNVMITKDGRIKILDFGLAKPMEKQESGDAVRAAADTLSAELTREGRVLGTVAYMSPEQAQGKQVDSRSDIFSFGIMLYEMAAGARPFRGDTPTSTLAKILVSDPEPIEEAKPDLPREIIRIIYRCLRKKPEERYNDTRDLLEALKDLRQETTSEMHRRLAVVAGKEASGVSSSTAFAGARKVIKPAPLWIFLIGIIVIVAMSITAWYFVKSSKAPTASVTPVHRQITFTGKAFTPTISPDGQYIAYAMKSEAEKDEVRIMVQDLTGSQPVEIQKMISVAQLLWSPRGTELLISGRNASNSWEAFIIPRFGGEKRSIHGATCYAFSPDGDQVASTNIAEKRLSFTIISTGEEKSIPQPQEIMWNHGLDWSSKGNLLLYLTENDKGERAIWTSTIDGKKYQKVIETNSKLFSPRFSPHGNAIYYLKQSESMISDLCKIIIDANSGEKSGEPRILLTGIPFGESFSLSADGKCLLYTRAAGFSNLRLIKRKDNVVGASIEKVEMTSGTIPCREPSISPDGKVIAFARGDLQKANIFTMPLEGGTIKQLTFFDSLNVNPAFSPDGKWIAFGSKEGGTPKVWGISLYGGTSKQFSRSMLSINSPHIAWAPSNKILYKRPGNRNFHLLDPKTEKEKPLLKDESVGWIFTPRFSPDGNHLAVYWNRTGKDGKSRPGIWIIDMKDSSSMPGFNEAYVHPVGWSSDGKWIYAAKHSSPRQMIRIPAGGGKPETLFDIPFKFDYFHCVMTADEKTFLFSVDETQSDVWLVDNFDPDVN